MARRYPDFFRDLEHCVDRTKSRSENYASLETQYKRVRNQHSSKALRDQPLLDQALKVFISEESYQTYLEEVRAEEAANASQSGKASAEAERRAAEAQRRAHKAEEEKRREAARRQDLERALEAQRQRAEEAERAVQQAQNQAAPGWGDLLIKGLAAWAESKRATPTAAPAVRPAALDLSGDWRTPDGFLCRIAHDGNHVRIQAWDQLGRFIADSSGGFDGNVVQVQFQTVPMPTMWGLIPTRGVATYQVFNGGRMMQGQIVNHVTGQATNVQLHRVS